MISIISVLSIVDQSANVAEASSICARLLGRLAQQLRFLPMQRYVVIVDAYSSASQLPGQFEKLGYKVIHVQSSPRTPEWYGPLRKADFVFEGNLSHLVRELQQYPIDAVMNGTDKALSLADNLAYRLRMPNNGLRLSGARRNKYLQVLALARNHVPVAESFASAKLDELLKWVERREKWPVVVKPTESSGSDGIHVCRNRDEVISAYRSLYGKQNGDGGTNTEVMVQEYLTGREYIVDTVSSNGIHLITDIWEYRKTEVPVSTGGKAVIYDYAELVPIEKAPKELVEYGKQTLGALRIRHGASHLEIMMTTQGPRLVEANPRIAGVGLPAYVEAAGNDNPTQITAEAMVSSEKFHQRLRQPTKSIQPGRIVILISAHTGIVKNVRHLAELQSLPSYQSHKVLDAGKRLAVTENLDTSPGIVFLTHPDPTQVEKDYQQIRRWESQGFFELE
ncbi:MAG: ATP-grasp domain-containing protein [Deltaproteobacteria bacterium]|nr:ATP-grasp domain-containing protein [Deltaproteobacteria bacterium]